ncbi:MAG: TIGR00730 family Rossman fold protein [Candidatus Zambryskibacteria bacterium CG10_big_fil_rev_8_21_14_0_10_42_12]|uniref:Putative pterin-4-alpha-carbinolamine dehydratase n=1 Tax=Candidatus Zambryskibacteria bacterium CG10_big_fil_rev_8_21_14_0_10_42_12 TaxID=1975115 RepID=A0A2H0QXH0_9BACT|nr:MAG: TIGR00730 family Rossman fold protein [Candidatus Zambryskibacteria bacterium CG10_big_fil_rev_8_21_14_0_10_42_12]
MEDINTPLDPKYKPLTVAEIHDATRKRVSLITKEFKMGFDFLVKHPKSVTFFGSARTPEDNMYYKKAERLGYRLAKEQGFSVITGGGPGIMEAAHKGAKEADGHAVGFTIRLPKEQATNKFVTDEIMFHYFFSRKVMLSFAAEAYVYFPGGFGTLDELFEILTLVQTGKIPHVPVVLVGSEFWDPLVSYIKDTLYENEHNISKEDLDLFTVLDDEDEIVELIGKTPVRNGLRHGRHGELERDSASASHPFDLEKQHCVPCESGGEPLTREACEDYMDNISGWDLIENKRLHKYFVFKNFEEAMDFVENMADIADEEGHHPDFSVHDWNRVDVTLSTHAVKGLTENDFIMAAKIDAIETDIFSGKKLE